MNVLLMRHGEAENFSTTDKERALTERGKKNSQSLLQVLDEKQLVPDLILASPYLRAQQTANIAVDVIAHNSKKKIDIETCPIITPEDDVIAAIRYLGTRTESLLMVVTHNPFITSVVHMLCSNSPGIRMGTSSLVYIEADEFAIGCGELKWERHV